ncbi:unnamed protein product [Lasius platythorax]|uniref:Transmembrane protein n=1 Tax=Lasius platythorax TaxID=488582 RepID=A0AAV2N3T5_9HYME
MTRVPFEKISCSLRETKTLPVAQFPDPLTPSKRQTFATKKHTQVVFDKCTGSSFCRPISRSRAQASLTCPFVTCARLIVSKARDFSSSHFSFFFPFFFLLFFFLRNENHTPVTSLSEVTRGYIRRIVSVLKDG